MQNSCLSMIDIAARYTTDLHLAFLKPTKHSLLHAFVFVSLRFFETKRRMDRNADAMKKEKAICSKIENGLLIDMIARVIFPVIFIIFNLIYCPFYLR